MRALCETLKVSTSGYYDWRDRPLSKRAKANLSLCESIVQAHQASDETYGMPRIRVELADAGVIASRKRIARLMLNAHAGCIGTFFTVVSVKSSLEKAL